MATYDDQQTKTLPEKKESSQLHKRTGGDMNEITGISPAEEQAMEDRAKTDYMAERERLDDKTGGPEIPYNAGRGKKKKGGFRATKKQGIVLGIVGLLGAGSFGATVILQGPLQFIHFGQLLQQFHFSNNDDFANGRTSRYLYYRTKGGAGQAKMNTRLGTVGNKVADRMELRLQERSGLRSLYDVSTGNLVGYEVVNEALVADYLASTNISPDTDIEFTEMDQNTIGSNGEPGSESRRMLSLRAGGDGKRMSLAARRELTKSLTGALGLNRVAAATSFRLTAARGGLDLHPIRRADRRVNESFVDFSRRLKERWAEETRSGAQTPGQVDLTVDDGEGNPTPESETANNEARQTQDDVNAGGESRASARARVAAGGVISVTVLCTVRELSNNVDEVKHSNIIMPLMRVGTRVVSLSSQVMSGQDLDMESLRVAAQDLNSAELGSWASARSIQAEMGNEPVGIDITPTAKPSAANDKPRILEIVDTIFDRAGAVGSAACSQIGQFVLDAVTGGVVAAVVSEAVGRAASAAGINPLDMFAEWVVNTIAGDMVPVDAVGADLGNIANYGARLAANEQAISLGGAELEGKETAELDTESKRELHEQFQSQH